MTAALAKPQSTSTLVAHAISTWRRGGSTPDAAQLLRDNPGLKAHKNLALDLIYEEYCLRRNAGEQLQRSAFCDRFPDYRVSLRRMIDVHEMFSHESGLLDWNSEELSWPVCGSTFLRCELIEELGKGALARVYLARQEELGGRPVALKIAKAGGHEARILGRLEHANIVPVYSVDTDRETGLTGVCMPFLGEATLSDLLDAAFATPDGPPERADVIMQAARSRSCRDLGQGTVAPDPCLAGASYTEGVVHLCRQLAEALSYAHGRGVLHCDLKPSNVLLGSDGRPMLLDFNLSCDAELEITRAGGTLPYMAHEQIDLVFLDPLDEPPRGDPRSDVFSLGVILYQLLTGRLPFGDLPEGEDPFEVAGKMRAARASRVVPPRELNAAVPLELDRLVLDCLAWDLAARPQTADELAERLGQVQTHLTRQTQPWTVRPKYLAGLAVAAALLLLLFGGVARQFPNGSEPPRRLTTLAAKTPSQSVRASGAGDLPSDNLDLYQRIGQLLREGDPAELETRAEIHRIIAELFHRKDCTGAASYAKVLHERAGDFDSLALLAYAYARDQDNRGALELLDQASRLRPTPAVLTNLGRVALELNMRQRALEPLNEALRRDPRSAAAYHNRALYRLKFAHQEFEEAIEDAERAIELFAERDIQSGRLHFTAAMAYGRAYQQTHHPGHLDALRHHVIAARQLDYPAAQFRVSARCFGPFFDEPWWNEAVGTPQMQPASTAEAHDPSRLAKVGEDYHEVFLVWPLAPWPEERGSDSLIADATLAASD